MKSDESELDCDWASIDKRALHIRLWIVPGSSRDELVGVYDHSLKIKVSAPPIEGRANRAVIKFLAGLLNQRENSFTLARGSHSRCKELIIACSSRQQAFALLQQVRAFAGAEHQQPA